MFIVGRVLGKRRNDPADTGGEKGMYDFYFLLIRFITLGHEDVVSFLRSGLLDAAQHTGKEMMYQLGYNDANGIGSAGTQVYSQHIRLVVVLLRVGMNRISGFLTDVRLFFSALDTVEGETLSARAMSLMVI